MIVEFESEQQLVLADVHELVDFPLESPNGIVEIVDAFGSARGFYVAVAEQIASDFELGVELLAVSGVLGQSWRQQHEVHFAALVLWA